jgi:hypothetical protein
MSVIDKLKTDLSSFNYKKVEKSRSNPSNTSNLPTPPARVSEVDSTTVSIDYSKLAGMNRGRNDVKQPGDFYLGMHRFNDGFGNIGLQVIKTIEDVERWAKWTVTPRGLLFNIKQAVLQRFNANSKTRIYNPLGVLASVLPYVHAPRHTKGTFIDFKNPPGYNKSVSKPMENADVTPEASGLGKSIGKLFDKLAGPEMAEDYGFKSGNLKGTGITSFLNPNKKLYDVTVHNALQVPYGGQLNRTGTTKLPKDFIKFRIRDLVNGKWLIFPAFLGSITDTVTPTYSQERYIGRPDSTHIYTGTDRSVSFDFKVAAFTKQEIPIIQEKMNYLVGLGYPSYKEQFTDDSGKRPVAPYISLTIGDLFKNTPGYFSSITITINETAIWELDDGFQIPMYFDVGCEFTYIGKYLPQTLGKHYEAPFLPEVVGEITPYLEKAISNVAHQKKYPFHKQMHNEAYKKTIGR